MGLTMSAGQRISSVAPEKVARAVIRAIERNKREQVLMPGPGRLLKALMDFFPGLGPAMNRVAGGEKFMASVADFREQQRREARDSQAM
jgi:hypothetical protein